MARAPRWRVAILDDHEPSRAALRGVISAAGGEVAGEASRCADADALIKRAKGSLMARFGLTEEDAFRRLRRAAMDSRKPMVEIAKALLVSESVTRGVPAE